MCNKPEIKQMSFMEDLVPEVNSYSNAYYRVTGKVIDKLIEENVLVADFTIDDDDHMHIKGLFNYEASVHLDNITIDYIGERSLICRLMDWLGK